MCGFEYDAKRLAYHKLLVLGRSDQRDFNPWPLSLSCEAHPVLFDEFNEDEKCEFFKEYIATILLVASTGTNPTLLVDLAEEWRRSAEVFGNVSLLNHLLAEKKLLSRSSVTCFSKDELVVTVSGDARQFVEDVAFLRNTTKAEVIRSELTLYRLVYDL